MLIFSVISSRNLVRVIYIMDDDRKYNESTVQLRNLGILNGLGNIKDLTFKGKYIHYIAIQRSYALFCCM